MINTPKFPTIWHQLYKHSVSGPIVKKKVSLSVFSFSTQFDFFFFLILIALQNFTFSILTIFYIILPRQRASTKRQHVCRSGCQIIPPLMRLQCLWGIPSRIFYGQVIAAKIYLRNPYNFLYKLDLLKFT